MRRLFIALYIRDLKLAMRRRIDVLLPLVFFVLATSLVPLSMGPRAETLREIGPGLVWVCALLAAMLSVTSLYAVDHDDGSLEQMLLAGQGAVVIAAAKSAAHWTLSGLPLVVAAPALGLWFDMDRPALLALGVSLALGTPILSLLGSVGAALTLGLRSGGTLVFLLILPLAIPALVFGTGSVAAVEGGQSPEAHYSMLGALLIFAALTALPAAAAALRLSAESA